MWTLATLFELGQGVAKDPEAARTWLRKSAEQGYVRGRKPLAVR